MPTSRLRHALERTPCGAVIPLPATTLLDACSAAAPQPAPPTASAAGLASSGPARIATDNPALDAAARAHPLAFLDRIGWGADDAQLRQLQRIGASRMLDQQLHPAATQIVPAEVARQVSADELDAPLIETIPPLFEQQRELRRSRRMAGGDADDTAQRLKALRQRENAMAEQAMQQQMLLAIHAPNQLQQRLDWFWINHFNVFRGGAVAPMMGDYAQRVIAAHSLGHFRDLLRATVFSPQMLLYLNNAQNARDHINENYARELMELHTLGVGSGYTQADVTHLAHVLSGLGVDLSGRPLRVRPALRPWVWQQGLVAFNPARHDPSPQVVLGHELQGQGVGEIEQVVTLLANDPATARHLSLELARYFVADDPDPAMVDAMVRSWRRSDGDIAAVLHTMFDSPQFVASLSHAQFKDPMRYVVSAVRASLAGRVVRNPRPLLGMLARLGEPLYGRTTPDGFPLGGASWSTPGQLTTRFEIAQALGAGAPAVFEPAPAATPDAAARMPGMASPAAARPLRPHPARVAPAPLSAGPVYLAAEPSLGASTRDALARAANPAAWNALWLSSPEFMNQ